MASRVVMPKLSDTMEEGRILRWLKKEGDTVETGQALAEVETDKATVEMEAYTNGTIRKLIATEGQFVKIGELIAIIGDRRRGHLGAAAGGRRAAPAAPKPQPPRRLRRRPPQRRPRRSAAAERAGADRAQPEGLAARAAHGGRGRPRPGQPAGHRAAGPHHQAGHRSRAWRRRRLAAAPARAGVPQRARSLAAASRRAKPAPRARTSNSRPCAAPSRSASSRARARCRTSI